MKRLAIVLAASTLLCTPASPRAAASPQKTAATPRLVVVLVVDQMRGDYPVRYSSLLSKGLKRLTTGGAWFRNAQYPYFNTLTCVGHTTIGTGSFPYAHGMIQNAWYDRESGKVTACTADPNVTDVVVEGAETGALARPAGTGDSAAKMMTPTLAEVLRHDLHSRVATVSMKARSAIGLAGHAADAVLWLSDKGDWETSSAYAKTPLPWVASFEKANPIGQYAGKVWERGLPAARYQGPDDPAGEKPGNLWSAEFPHPLGSADDRLFITHLETSPFSDEYIEKMAEAAIDELDLGQKDTTDFLGVSFSGVDIVGHAFGPRSHEIQDMLYRLDATIGRLLDHLDAKVGAGKYVLALSADHGVSDVPEQVPGAGRIMPRTVTANIEAAMKPAFGDGPFVAANLGEEVYFKPGVYDRLKSDPATMKAVIDAIMAVPGVARVIRSEEVSTAAARTAPDRILRAAALSYHAGRNGDLILLPKPNWIPGNSTATHGSPYFYDQHVPLIFYGAGIRPGQRTEAATPADAAATLASMLGVHLPRTDGRVLTGALAGTKRMTNTGGMRP
jgi:predicted AlkP superfamily pyrophosphatase or phosphodiesterase